MSQRRNYSPDFKREAVALSRQSGVTIRQVADELGIPAGNLSRWKRELDGSSRAFSGTGSPRDEEVAQLKRELARVKKERDFLAKAATFFAKESS